MAGTITLWDAVLTWLRGQEVDGQATMGGLRIIWWGRIGKVAGFLGGSTVILDLIGPERLRQMGAEQKVRRPFYWGWGRWLTIAISILIGFTFFTAWASSLYFLSGDNPYVGDSLFRFIPLAATVAATIYAGYTITRVAPRAIAAILDRERPAQALRYVAVALLVVGFCLDLLAS